MTTTFCTAAYDTNTPCPLVEAESPPNDKSSKLDLVMRPVTNNVIATDDTPITVAKPHARPTTSILNTADLFWWGVSHVSSESDQVAHLQSNKVRSRLVHLPARFSFLTLHPQQCAPCFPQSPNLPHATSQ